MASIKASEEIIETAITACTHGSIQEPVVHSIIDITSRDGFAANPAEYMRKWKERRGSSSAQLPPVEETACIFIENVLKR
ncbi:MAG: hypothetical protein JWO53_442 [Chlamydiia bacterium]|nr:hypothetical protein [Chlamydiia bacterium]